MHLDQLDILLDKYTMAPRALLDGLGYLILLNCFWHVKNIQVGSPSDADQGKPSRPLSITHTDRARPVPNCLIKFDRVDRISSGNIVLTDSVFSTYTNKRAQRALGRSPEEKVKGHSGANNREPQGHNLDNFGKGSFDDVLY